MVIRIVDPPIKVQCDVIRAFLRCLRLSIKLCQFSLKYSLIDWSSLTDWWKPFGSPSLHLYSNFDCHCLVTIYSCSTKTTGKNNEYLPGFCPPHVVQYSQKFSLKNRLMINLSSWSPMTRFFIYLHPVSGFRISVNSSHTLFEMKDQQHKGIGDNTTIVAMVTTCRVCMSSSRSYQFVIHNFLFFRLSDWLAVNCLQKTRNQWGKC